MVDEIGQMFLQVLEDFTKKQSCGMVSSFTEREKISVKPNRSDYSLVL